MFHEKLHRQIIRDYPARIAQIEIERDTIENDLVEKVEKMEPEEKKAVSHQAFANVRRLTSEWIKRLESMPIRNKPALIYDRYWKSRNRKAGLMVWCRLGLLGILKFKFSIKNRCSMKGFLQTMHEGEQ